MFITLQQVKRFAPLRISSLILTITLLIFYGVGIGSMAYAQTTFQKTFGGNDLDYASSVQQTTDGGYIITGYTSSFGVFGDVYIIKTNSLGDTLWTKTYGNSGWDAGEWIEQTSDGGYIATGFRDVWNGVTYLFKLDSLGDTLWTRAYQASTASGDLGCYVQETTDGGFVMVGVIPPWPSPGAVMLRRTNSNGGLLWTKIYGNVQLTANQFIEHEKVLEQTSDGGYIITGNTTDTFGNQDICLIKTDSSGNILWTKSYGGGNTEVSRSISLTTDQGYIIAGVTTSFGAGGEDVYLIRADSSGSVLWTKTYGGAGDDAAYSVRQTVNGGYIIAGITNSFGFGNDDVYVINTDASGNLLWSKTYGGTGAELAYSIQNTNDGGYIIAGSTKSFGAGNEDVYLIKMDSTGNAGCNYQIILNTIVGSPATSIGTPAITVVSLSDSVLNRVTIVSSTPTQVSGFYSVMITDSANVLCANDSSGFATVTAGCGTPPYSYLWNDQGAQTNSTATGLPAGTYQVIVTDSSGLTDLVTVTIGQPTALSITITNTVNVVCNGDSTGSTIVSTTGGTPTYSYLWNDPFSQTDSMAIGLPAGTYTVVVTDSNGCSAIDSVTITEPLATFDSASTTICSNDSVFLQGEYQNTAGIYYDTLLSASNCDSVIATTVMVNTSYVINTADKTICDGDSTLIFGVYQSIAGTYYDSLTTINSCDSIISATLYINPTYNINTGDINICSGDSVQVFGVYYKTAGTYYDSSTTVIGCDSITITTLIVNQTYDVNTPDVTICDGDSMLIFSIYRETAGTYYDSLNTINGCDSIISAIVYVDPAYSIGDSVVTICDGDSTSIYGTFRSASGTYYDSLITDDGCDSVYWTVLAVNPLPLVSFSGLDSIYCSMDAAVALTGVPDSGTFNGMGVANNYFYPTTGVNTYVVTYSYTDSLGCSGSYSQSVIVEFCVGIDANIYSDLIKVLPNPTTGLITVTGLAAERARITVYNVLGELVYDEELMNRQIDLSHLPGGVYMIYATQGETAHRKRIIKL